MTESIEHRGPDDVGVYRAGAVVLGHRRLSIVDLGGGHQPMANEDETVWIAYNGEVYNHAEYRRPLEQAGHVFRSRCDTEVLLAAYQEWGEGCLDRLRGMFAFAIWDEQEQRLFAARDRLGIKPFHYWTSAGATQVAFASELKALLEFLPERRVTARLAGEFLAWNLLDHDPAETMLQGISRLPAAHFLIWNRRGGGNRSG
jgi:asparagine synthase (glutamine-hydrolysing)